MCRRREAPKEDDTWARSSLGHETAGGQGNPAEIFNKEKGPP